MQNAPFCQRGPKKNHLVGDFLISPLYFKESYSPIFLLLGWLLSDLAARPGFLRAESIVCHASLSLLFTLSLSDSRWSLVGYFGWFRQGGSDRDEEVGLVFCGESPFYTLRSLQLLTITKLPHLRQLLVGFIQGLCRN